MLNTSVDKKTPLRRNFISLEMKIHILDRLKNGEKATYIAKNLQLNEATVRTIKQNEEKIRAAVAAGSSFSARVAARPRAAIIEKMEGALSTWIAECNGQQIRLNGNKIKEKALSIYNELKENGEAPVNPEFVASKGWYERFKKRFSLHNMRNQEEGTLIVPEIVEEENFTLESIEGGLYLAEQLESYFWRTDPSTERSARFQREFRKCMAPYRKIYKELLDEDRKTHIAYPEDFKDDEENLEPECSMETEEFKSEEKKLKIECTLEPEEFKGEAKDSKTEYSMPPGGIKREKEDVKIEYPMPTNKRACLDEEDTN